MKKLVVLCSLLLAFGTVPAQIPGFSIGPKIGYNSNRLTSDIDSITSDPEGSFQVGAFIRIGKKVYFQPEVSYVIKGGSVNIRNFGVQEITLKTITVPMLVGVRPINAGIFNLRFMAGPTMSFVSGKSIKPGEVIESWPIKSAGDIKDAIWSFQMGAGVDLFLMTIDVRYEIGVDNIYTGESDFGLRNNLLNISLGIKLL